MQQFTIQFITFLTTVSVNFTKYCFTTLSIKNRASSCLSKVDKKIQYKIISARHLWLN